MIIHHLDAGSYDDFIIYNHGLFSDLSKVSKVCVAIFVFLSGYGLMAQTQAKGSLGSISSFYFHRFKKLYFNYWFIWLIFVPISYYYFGMTFEKVYHSPWHLFTDLLGINGVFFDAMNYNPTWWFYSCIILLYLFFPLFYVLNKEDSITIVLLSFVLTFLPVPYVSAIRGYAIAFCLGICLVPTIELKQKQSFYLSPKSIRLKMGGILVLVFILFVFYRFSNSYPLLIDILITLAMIRLYTYLNVPKKIKPALLFLGKHSMNIFLIHTFIAEFWFKDFVYVSHNPFIALITIFAICIPLSMCLEYLKKYTIYKII